MREIRVLGGNNITFPKVCYTTLTRITKKGIIAVLHGVSLSEEGDLNPVGYGEAGI
jgi:hypothetical protein